MNRYFAGLFFGMVMASGVAVADDFDDWDTDGQVTAQNKEQSKKMEQAKAIFNKCRELGEAYGKPFFFIDGIVSAFTYKDKRLALIHRAVTAPVVFTYFCCNQVPEIYEGGLIKGPFILIRQMLVRAACSFSGFGVGYLGKNAIFGS